MGAQEKPSSTTHLLSKLMENIGAHGIPNIRRAPNLERRVAWALFFVFGLGMFIWQSTVLVVKYFEFGVDVNINIVYDPEPTFPAVTVCNLNGIRKSALDSCEDLNDLLGENDGYGTSREIEYQGWDDLDYGDSQEVYDRISQTIDIMASRPYENRTATGHFLSEMMLSCNFKGLPCSPLNFTHFYNYLYGNCYTFNFDNETAQKITSSGPIFGLTMEFYIQEDEYIPALQCSAGMKVLIESQNQMPFPEDKGVIVSTGQETSIALNKVQIDRIGEPYTNCTTNRSTVFSEFFGDVDYSLLACEKSCLFKKIVEKCRCADHRYRFTEDYPPCYSTNKTQGECSYRVVKDYIAMRFDCNCTLPCREIVFEETVSSSLWPNTYYKSTVEGAVGRLSYDLYKAVNENSEFVESNLLKVNVFYSGLQYQRIYQTPSYDEANLISDLGGQVGLWMGVSILTLFEFGELIFDLLKLFILRSKPERKVSTGKLKEVEDSGLSNSTVMDTLSTVG